MKEAKINAMGSEVVDGFACKPKVKDPDKPMMFYRYHILICDGDECDCNAKKALSDKLRDLAKELKMDKGQIESKSQRQNVLGLADTKGSDYSMKTAGRQTMAFGSKKFTNGMTGSGESF